MTEHGIDVVVNGERHQSRAEPRRTLADFLRGELLLTGTHVGCEHGVCGACTVLVDGEPVRSCLMLAVQADGHEITTIEGLADTSAGRAVQQAAKESHAFQCGFCTAGFLTTMSAMVAEGHESLSRAAIREQLSGNICRCSGYQPIVDAVEVAIASLAASRSTTGSRPGGGKT